MRHRVRLALASAVLAVAVVVIPQSAFADTDGSVLVGVDIAPRAEPTDLVRTGFDPAPLVVLALGLGLAGAGTVVAVRRRHSSAQIAAISSR